MPESLHQPNDALRRAREERGWTQNDAALALGCSLEAVQSWERGRRSRPGPRWRARLCEVYQRSPEELGLVPAPPQHTKTAAAQEVSATSLAACEPEDAIAETKRQGDVPDVFKARRQTEEHSSPSPKGERSRRVLLARGRKNWIDGVLHPCLQEAGLLQLDLVECPDALAHPRSPSTRERTAVAHPLPAGTSLDQLYHLTGDLLVLGERGAGKTTLLLDLFEDLLAHAEDWECEPMPVVFPLASWSGKHTSLAEWLVEVLEEDYFIAKQVGHHWIDTDRLIVLLDDLHQVPEALRQGCVEAIDAYQKAHPEVPLVVCCQTEAYFAQPIRLRFSQAVEIQPLTPAHIVQYLDRVSGQQAVRQAVLEDRHLREFCSNPFLLRLMVELTNQGEATTALALTGSREARRQQLFDVYVHRQQHDSLSAPSSEEQTITSLSWLARQMTLHHQSTYYVERMQPTC